MSKGELKRQIRAMLDIITYDKEKKIDKIIDEAKKEFPDFAKLTDIVCSEFEIKVQIWFLKWFGDEK